MTNQPLEPLICPQCGGQVDEKDATGDLARCEYCSTKFHVSRPVPAVQWSVPAAMYSNVTVSRKGGSKANVAIILIVSAAFAGFIFYMVSGVQRKTNDTINQAQEIANSAQLAANAMKQAANAMADAQRAVNAVSIPKPTPGPTSH